MANGLRVAIAHDYLTQCGGAERVVLAMLRVFPEATLITSVYDPERTFPEFRARPVRTTWLDRVPAFRRDPRLALPFLGRAFEQTFVTDVDVVVCSSSAFAHGVQTDACKVVYCHNPPRFVYQPHDYFRALPASVRSMAGGASIAALRRWDRRAAAGASAYVANSSVVRSRIASAYGMDALVVHPPLELTDDGPSEAVAGIEPGYLLTIGRARGYKNTVVVAEALVRSDERLVVVGDLPARMNGRPWPDRVRALGQVSDAELRWLYANADALVAVSHEDFGLTPIEAYGFGTPALVLRAGGYLDTAVPGFTGEWVEAPEPAAVLDAVVRFRGATYDPVALAAHAREQFGMQRFAEQLRAVVAAAYDRHEAVRRVPAASRPLRVVHADRRARRQPVPFERREPDSLAIAPGDPAVTVRHSSD